MLSPQFSFFEDDATFDPRSGADHEASFRCMRKSQSDMREEAVSRYRRNLPEYAYELSFRDLVELPTIVSSMQKARESGRDSFRGFWSGQEKTKTRKGTILRMFFPLPPSGRKKSSSRTSGSCSTISSKSLSINGDEYELQKSRSSRSSSSSSKSSIGSDNSKKVSIGCYPFFHTCKNNDLRGFC